MDISEEYDADDFDREGRIFTSGGSLNLNSTFLTAAGDDRDSCVICDSPSIFVHVQVELLASLMTL